MDRGFIDYPDEWFPIEVHCPRCRKTYEYPAKELRTETSHKPFHPVGWKPILPDPPVPLGNN
jgi:hypothetical protein